MKINRVLCLCIFLCLVFNYSVIYSQITGIKVLKNNIILKYNSTIYALAKDQITLKVDAPDFQKVSWYTISPIQKQYEIYNLKKGKHEPIDIEYQINEIKNFRGKAELVLNADHNGLQLGTVFYTALNDKEIECYRNKPIISKGYPELKSGISVIELVVRKDDTYIGYLTELYNVPFGLMPLRVNDKHQTDMCVLTDCAEFAIYGKRRQGFKIGYSGPARIEKYLNKTHSGVLIPIMVDGQVVYCNKETNMPFSLSKNGIKPGDIIHFGDQVAVFVEDRGVKGILDPDDLMFYSFNKPPRILAIKDSEFKNRPLKIYQWKY